MLATDHTTIDRLGGSSSHGSPKCQKNRIAGYRSVPADELLRHQTDPLTCLVLRAATFLPERMWIPWADTEEWARNIVAYKRYDLGSGPGLLLADLLQRVPTAETTDLEPEFEPLVVDARETVVREVRQRIGQGTFRTRVLSAYHEQCAITAERAVPVLDAAHIQPYRAVASNHIQNGLLLRADLHRLYDEGYLTVTPDLRVEVSRRLKDEFDNGEPYYPLAGQRVQVPERAELQPSRLALDWHASNIFQ